MKLNIKSRTGNGTIGSVESDCGRYSWFWGSDGYIQDAVADRAIYQMSYMRRTEFGSDPLPDDVRADVRMFWSLLEAEQQAIKAAKDAAELEAIRGYKPVVRTGIAGIHYPCGKCGSYCAGDCTAA